jgi:hypothetical protein
VDVPNVRCQELQLLEPIPRAHRTFESELCVLDLRTPSYERSLLLLLLLQDSLL